MGRHRWRGQVAGWEVWEPDPPDWASTDPVAYVRLLQPAYRAIKLGDPQAKVIFGGVSYNDDKWIARAYDVMRLLLHLRGVSHASRDVCRPGPAVMRTASFSGPGGPMLPQLVVHQPKGILPKVALRKRTVVDYQPSWLLVAVPALLALRNRRKASKASASSAGNTASAFPATTTATPAPQRRRPRQILVVSTTRLRRRPTPSATATPAPLTGETVTS